MLTTAAAVILVLILASIRLSSRLEDKRRLFLDTEKSVEEEMEDKTSSCHARLRLLQEAKARKNRAARRRLRTLIRAAAGTGAILSLLLSTPVQAGVVENLRDEVLITVPGLGEYLRARYEVADQISDILRTSGFDRLSVLWDREARAEGVYPVNFEFLPPRETREMEEVLFRKGVTVLHVSNDVQIAGVTPTHLLVAIQDEDDGHWEVMTYRLSSKR